MTMLVTLTEAKDRLRYDNDDADDDITLMIKSISNSILNYLKDYMLAYQFEQDDNGQPVLDSDDEKIYLLDSNGDYIAREEVQQAVLLMLGYVDRDRDVENYTDGDSRAARLGDLSLPRAVHWILDPIRTPTIG